jgi:hypothetical protein
MMGVGSGVVSLPTPRPGDDEVGSYGKLIGLVVGIISAVIAILVLVTPSPSSEEGSTCQPVPGHGLAFACNISDRPKNWKERNCIPGTTVRNVTIWTCQE